MGLRNGHNQKRGHSCWGKLEKKGGVLGAGQVTGGGGGGIYRGTYM